MMNFCAKESFRMNKPACLIDQLHNSLFTIHYLFAVALARRSRPALAAGRGRRLV